MSKANGSPPTAASAAEAAAETAGLPNGVPGSPSSGPDDEGCDQERARWQKPSGTMLTTMLLLLLL